MKKKIKLVTAIIMLIVGMMLVIPTYASTKSSITMTTDDMGEDFLKKVVKTKGNKDIYLKYRSKEDLANFAYEVKAVSNAHSTYDIETEETLHTNKKGKVKLSYTTKDFKEMESGKMYFDLEEKTGKDFIKSLHSSKADSQIVIGVTAETKKGAIKQLKRFQKEVKEFSKFGLSYEIYTEDNVKQLKDFQKGCTFTFYIPLKDRTKDMLACEKMVSNIKDFKYMSDNRKFLALAKKCQMQSKWHNQQWNDFHFYKKDNKLVCYDYAYMYKRVAEMITDKARTEIVLNKDAKHALAIICIGNSYYEGNNDHLSKKFHWKDYDIRSWYNTNPKKFGSKLVKGFIKANGK